MELSGIEVAASPNRPEWTRLSARVCYDSDGFAEDLWYEVPSEHADCLSITGDPWLVVLAPAAFALREPLRIGAVVDPVLLDGVRRALAVWQRWYAPLVETDVQAEKTHESTGPAGRGRTAVFFSGGVDSFATLLYDRALEKPVIDDLLFVHGADIPVEDDASFERVLLAMRTVADSFGMPLVPVRTNIRSSRFSKANYPKLSCGALFASSAHALSGRFSGAILSAGNCWPNPPTWGSHPDTDPLLSSSMLRIEYVGGHLNRIDKMRVLAESPVAASVLRVCWRGLGSKNCGRCEKCYRTMASLDVFDRLNEFNTFSDADYDVRRIGRLVVLEGYTAEYWEEIVKEAEERGHPEIARYARLAIRRSRLVYRPLRRVARSLERQHLVWPLGKVINACLDSYFVP